MERKQCIDFKNECIVFFVESTGCYTLRGALKMHLPFGA